MVQFLLPYICAVSSSISLVRLISFYVNYFVLKMSIELHGVTSAPATTSGIHPVSSWPAVTPPVHSLSPSPSLCDCVVGDRCAGGSCKSPHNQDLYKYSGLPLPFCLLSLIQAPTRAFWTERSLIIWFWTLFHSIYLWMTTLSMEATLLCFGESCSCYPASLWKSPGKDPFPHNQLFSLTSGSGSSMVKATHPTD